jgi:hypothetical protein
MALINKIKDQLESENGYIKPGKKWRYLEQSYNKGNVTDWSVNLMMGEKHT